MSGLYQRFGDDESLGALLAGSDEDVLVALAGRPALIRVPAAAGSRAPGRARLLACLVHGNEDSGYRAVLDLLRARRPWPYDLWVLIGNPRAASQDGWFAHRFLDDQEDFNRVWGLGQPTTRMRRCADELLAELASADLEAAVDLHNNTGANPPYAIVPVPREDMLRLAAVCAPMILDWGQRAHTLMEALAPYCPTVAVECGQPGRAESTEFARAAIERFLSAPAFDDGPPDLAAHPLYELRARVDVRAEVPFAFGGELTDEIDLVLRPGLDSHNFGMLLAGTEIGQCLPGAAMPLCARDLAGRDVTVRYLTVTDDGRVVVAEDLTPAMMTTNVEQTRRDCLFYVARRRG